MKVKIVLPPRASTSIDLNLCYLTEVIVKNKLAEHNYGLLGGKFGYGADFENETFMMHSFCWCERETCKWCSFELPNFLHKPSGLKIWWYKWIGRDMDYGKEGDGDKNKPSKEKWDKIFQECLSSLVDELHEEVKK